MRAASLALCFLGFLALVLRALDLAVLLTLARLRLAVARKDGETADGHAGAARARTKVEGRGRVAPHAHGARGGAHTRIEEVNVRRLAEQRVVPA